MVYVFSAKKQRTTGDPKDGKASTCALAFASIGRAGGASSQACAERVAATRARPAAGYSGLGAGHAHYGCRAETEKEQVGPIRILARASSHAAGMDGQRGFSRPLHLFPALSESPSLI